jgi:DoxX-like protein
MNDQHLNKTCKHERHSTMKNIMRWLSQPPVDGPESTVLLRVMAGGVFFWEGILKFVYVNQGVGRFTKLGMPFPIFTADFVGGLEIAGGVLLLAGLLTRWIAIPFVIEMIGGDAFDQDLALPRDVASSVAAGAAKDRRVGGFA